MADAGHRFVDEPLQATTAREITADGIDQPTPAGPGWLFDARFTIDRALAAIPSADRPSAGRPGDGGPGDGGSGDSGAGDSGAAAPVERVTVGDRGFADASPFALTAAQNLVLFTFITCVTSATLLVRSRRQGILGRALTTPAGTGLISVGLAASWFLVALAQSALIVVVGAMAFGVDWGDPLAAAVLVVTFAATGAGAGLLLGALFGSEERLGAASAPIGLVLGALGGCMVPAEFFPDSIRTVAAAVPHFWALEGWHTVLFDGGSLADIARPLAILATFAVVFVAAGATVLRRTLTAAGR